MMLDERQLERYNAIPEQVRTVILKNGTVVSSSKYALAHVRKYYDRKVILKEFGPSFDIEDLQVEALVALLRAAWGYLAAGKFNKPFRPYLSTCINTRLYRLHDENWRHNPIHGYLPTIDDIVDTLEEGYEGIFPDHPVGKFVASVRDFFIDVQDVFEQVDSLEAAMQFLQTLTSRQSSIIRYKMENGDVDEGELCQELHLARTTLWREETRIKNAYITYAMTTEKSWLRFLKRLERYGK